MTINVIEGQCTFKERAMNGRLYARLAKPDERLETEAISPSCKILESKVEEYFPNIVIL